MCMINTNTAILTDDGTTLLIDDDEMITVLREGRRRRLSVQNLRRNDLIVVGQVVTVEWCDDSEV